MLELGVPHEVYNVKDIHSIDNVSLPTLFVHVFVALAIPPTQQQNHRDTWGDGVAFVQRYLGGGSDKTLSDKFS